MVNVGDALKNGMETTINSYTSDDCLSHDCGGSDKVKFELDSAGSVSLFGNNSD